MKCINCKKELKKGSVFCDACGIHIKEKNNKKTLIIIFIISFVISSILVIFTSIYLINNKGKSDDLIIQYDNYIIYIDNYKLKIPNTFDYFTSEENNRKYIKNNECTIDFEKYLISTKQIHENKELLIYNLKKQGYEVIDYKEENYKDNTFILINSKIGNIDYGLVFYTFDEELTLFLKIQSNNFSNFDNNWFKYVENFLISRVD